MTPEDERAAGADRIGRALEGAVVNGERARRRTRDGRDVWVDIYAARAGGRGGPDASASPASSST